MIFESKKELRKELENAELRAVTHFRKLNQIETIIKNGEEKKETCFEMIKKIKDVIKK